VRGYLSCSFSNAALLPFFCSALISGLTTFSAAQTTVYKVNDKMINKGNTNGKVRGSGCGLL
jgi:hypothetical protein